MDKKELIAELSYQLKNNLMDKWYPLVLDKEYGGYYSDISSDWKLIGKQPKMLVTQSRHVWVTAKLAKFFNSDFYREVAEHGYLFLRNHFWDNDFGGFYIMRNRQGKRSDYLSYEDEKRCYANAFAIYGLAAFYELTGDESVLELAKRSFFWLEKNSFDRERNGYFQFLTREGKQFSNTSEHKSKAFDLPELGFKDQNSSIHLMEAYAELYNVWKEDELAKQLNNLLLLIRDKYTSDKGYLNLFFDHNLNPFRYNKSKEDIIKDHRLDHVSFGHDYETGFLMLEASFALKIPDDKKTLFTAKKMLDHAIENGWDSDKGGFYEAGYYFDEKCEIIQSTKNWWAQAEGMNALLLMYNIFPDEKKYYEMFLQLWDFVKKYLVDKKNGGWYWGSLDKEPEHKHTPKGTIWKATYHNGRALMNCIKMLSDEPNKMKDFINYWKKIKH